jgi:cytochrome c oxidase subunit IV
MANHVTPIKTYLAVYLALMLLLVTTVGLDFLRLGPFNVIASMTIAALKTLLVILYFMHVRHSSRLIWIFVGVGFYWLAILLTLTMSDFVSRTWPPFGGPQLSLPLQ